MSLTIGDSIVGVALPAIERNLGGGAVGVLFGAPQASLPQQA